MASKFRLNEQIPRRIPLSETNMGTEKLSGTITIKEIQFLIKILPTKKPPDADDLTKKKKIDKRYI